MKLCEVNLCWVQATKRSQNEGQSSKPLGDHAQSSVCRHVTAVLTSQAKTKVVCEGGVPAL